MELLFLVIPIVIAVSALLGTPYFRGKLGEYKVNRTLERQLDQSTYETVKDVTLPDGDGTTQIDHLVVSPYGVFVIETKNMKGWIFGQPDQARWTQTIYQFKAKFQNPLRQNHKHVKVVQKLLGLHAYQVHSVVVFVSDCTFKTPMPSNVVRGRLELVSLIESKSMRVFAEGDTARIVANLADKRLRKGFWTDIVHIRSIKARKRLQRTRSKIACPRCGATMVRRVNRKSGNPFLGCRRYPSCTGTRSLPLDA